MTQSVPFFQVDAFAAKSFRGNPAAVMLLDNFPEDQTLQAIARENNLSETTFLVRRGGGDWDLRWFTPGTEVRLCGHATLAAAHILMSEGIEPSTEVRFQTRRAGELRVTRNDHQYAMRLPRDYPEQISVPAGLSEALGAVPEAVYAGPYILALLESEAAVRALTPDIRALATLGNEASEGPGNFICAARGEDNYDVVSRFFAPGSGIDEDPATGSAHCTIAPIFSQLLGKTGLSCFQAPPGRGAEITTQLSDETVIVSGSATTVIRGEFFW